MTTEDLLRSYHPTRAELLDLARAQMKAAGSVAEGETSLIPQLLVRTKQWPGGAIGHEVYALAVPFNEHAEKHAVLRGIGARLYGEQKVPIAAALAAEAWAAADRPGLEPRHSPDRREVIIVQAASINHLFACATADVTRDAENRMRPAPWSEIVETGRARLLLSLWAGLAETLVAARAARGEPAPEWWGAAAREGRP